MPDLPCQPSGRRRRSRRHSAFRRRRSIVLAIAAAVLVAAVWIGAAAVLEGPVDSPATVTAEQYEWLKRALVDNTAASYVPTEAPTTAAARAVYKYSVIPGGAYDGEELRRALADPVVAAHYEKVDRTNIRTEVVPADRYVHVSYRKGDTIFWSKKKVLLRKGETILTDGTTQIRSRCGNCISEEPLAPTAADEPDVVEFDRLVDSIAPRDEAPGATATNVTGESTRAGLVPAQSAPTPGPTPAGAPMPVAGGAMPFIGGGGAGGSDVPLVAATRSGNREPDDTPGDAPTTEDGSTPPGNPQGPGPGTGEPDIDVPPLTDLPFPPSGNGPPKLDDLLPPGPDRPNGPNDVGPTSENPTTPSTGNDPVNPVPVPEPGTFMLVGGGVAALLRRLRARSRS